MNHENPQTVYSEHADEMVALLDNPKVNRFEHEVVWPKLKELLPEKPRTVLDYGCGSGYFTSMLTRQFPEAQVIGTDISEEMLAHARTTRNDIRWQVWNGITKPSEEWREVFDLIVCKMVLQYVHGGDLRKIAHNLTDALSPEGRIVVSVPHPVDTMAFNTRRDQGDERDFGRRYRYEGRFVREIGMTGLCGTMYHRSITGWMRPFEEQGLGADAFEEPCLNGRPRRLILRFRK